MKIQIFLISIFCALNANAQDFLITFSGTGASSNVSTVKVENLTAGTSLIINGNDILHLKTIITGVNSIKDDQPSEIKIYPNPMSDNSTLQIYAPVAGDAVMTVLDITGKPVARIQSFLENTRQDFNLAGLKTGFYIINVKGKNYKFSGKLFSYGKSNGTINIEKVNLVIQKTEEKAPEEVSKGLPATVDMAYTSGDRLKFTGISGNYSTVKTDIPTSDKTIAFNFIACTDADNNNYPVVEIGNQIWMAENLKTTKFNDGTAISLVTDNQEWSQLESTPKYCWYNNDPATFKDAYGALYNWSVSGAQSNGGKNACPVGWYVPNYSELTTLIQSATGGMLKETGFTHWLNPNTDASNETGFTALPGGLRLPGGLYIGNGLIGDWWSSWRGFTDNRKQTIEMSSGNGSVTTYGINEPVGFSVRCIHGEMILPTINTTAVSSLTNTSAKSGGNIISYGYYEVNARGICWSTSPNPTIADYRSDLDGGAGTYVIQMNDLAANTTYYVRSYFYTNHYYGPVYGNELVFKTYTGTVTDIDGNKHYTVTIGSQLWMAENLKTTKYNDGTSIPQVTENAAWAGLSSPGYCWYNNDATANKSAYGALYNWYVLDNTGNGGKNVCPVGWQVPTDEEWTTMTDWLKENGYGNQGNADDIAKSMSATSGWNMSSIAGTPGNDTAYNNTSGFTALPAGYRNLDGTFGNIVDNGYWWSSSDSWYRNMNFGYGKVYRGQWGLKHGFSVRCVHGPIYPPTVTTEGVTSITLTTATSGGNVTSAGGSPVTARGVCWSTSYNPTIADSHTSDGIGLGSFCSNLTGLSQHTLYFVRAYATNSMGTEYGKEISFFTQIADADGNAYHILTIHNQTWMVENLKTTRYRNGDLIGTTTPSGSDIGSENAPAYQWPYDGNDNNVAAYGRLYTWYAVKDNRNLCPEGWHVPTEHDWNTLTWYLDTLGLNIAGGKLKEANYDHWLSPNTGATNKIGFTALPGGYRLSNGIFGGLGSDGIWWSLTEINPANNEALSFGMGSTFTDAIESRKDKHNGYSIRCIGGEVTLPSVITSAVSSITATSAICGGDVTNDGGTDLIEKGVCWSTSPNPTPSDSKMVKMAGVPSFIWTITELNPNTTYYIRAFATNGVGTGYGNQLIFTTLTK